MTCYEALLVGKEKITKVMVHSKSKPPVSLQWRKDLTKEEEKGTLIGLSKHNLPLSQQNRHPQALPCVVDVLDSPQGILALKDLADVLSFQTWKSILSNSEREHLSNFLPSGCKVDYVVGSLLSGENINFGNPFSSWGTSVCNGSMHPDAIIARDAERRLNHKAYCCHLRSYHENMVATLQELKEIWRTSSCSERDLPEKFQRWMKSKASKNPLTIGKDKSPHIRDEIRTGIYFEKEKPSLNGVLAPYTTTREDGVDKDGKTDLRKTTKRCRSGRSSEASERENTSGEIVGNGFSNLHRSTATVSEEVPFDCMQAVKVSRRKLEEILEKNKSGGELNIASLKSVLGTKNVNSEKGRTHRNGISSQVTGHWHIIVHNDVPRAHKTWNEWKLQTLKCAKLFAEQCILQLPRVCRPRFQQNVNIVPSEGDVDMKIRPLAIYLDGVEAYSDEQKSSDGHCWSLKNFELESIMLAGNERQIITQKSPYINMAQHEMAPLSCSPGVFLAAKNSHMDSGDKRQKSSEHPQQDMKQNLREKNSFELALMPSHCNVSSMHARMEMDNACNRGESVTESNSKLQNVGSRDVTPEDEEVSAVHQEDEVSAIHQIWSTGSPDTQILATGQGAILCENENDTLGVKCASYWENSISTGKSLNTTLLRGELVQEEEKQHDILQVEHECTVQSYHLVEPRPMLPAAPCKEISLIAPISSSVSYVDDNSLQDGDMSYQQRDRVTEGNKTSNVYAQCEQIAMAQLFPTAIPTEKSDTWKFPHSPPEVPGEVSSGHRLLQMDHPSSKIDHTQAFTPRLTDPQESSLRLELDINQSSLPEPSEPDDANVMRPFSNGYDLDHQREEHIHQGNLTSVRPELQLLRSHDSLEQKNLPHWAYSSQRNEENQHSCYHQRAPNLSDYHVQRTQHVGPIQQRSHQPSSSIKLNSSTSSSWPTQSLWSKRSETAFPLAQMENHVPSWGNENNVMHSPWSMTVEKRLASPPQGLDNRSTSSHEFVNAPSLVGYGSNLRESSMGSFSSNMGPQGEWAAHRSFHPTDGVSYNQNNTSYGSDPFYGWMNMASTRSHSSSISPRNPLDPSCHPGPQSSGLHSSWVRAGGIKNCQLSPWMQNVHRHYP